MTAPVAVAVVSWNTRGLLGACLRSLVPEIDAGRADVWVVDNGSTDGSPEMVSDEFPQIHLLEPGENLGFGPAVNLVAERTDAAWIAPANADVELTEGALATLLETAEADPRIGAVAPRLITLEGTTQHSVHRFPTVPLSLAVYSGLARAVPGLGHRLCLEGYWDDAQPRAIDWAHGAFLLVRHAAYEPVGGFDPEQWMYAEDLDIGWRLARDGWAFRYEPRARVRHAVSAATVQAFGDERQARYMRASYAWMARRRGLARTWGFASVNVAGSLLRWLLAAPAALLGRGAESRGRWRTYARLHALGLRRRAHLLAHG